MLRRVWGEFGLEEDQVGFWREEDGRFHFEP
jgi:hypothetical protein